MIYMWYRLRDIVLASMGLILLSPVLLGIMIWLWATQRKVFFLQRRPGLHEQPFTLIKFSTMIDALPGVPEEHNQQARLTPAGKILRETSLDELPNLFNVLKGDMSLVGPRPLLMEYLSLYSPEDKIRHQVKPGITGWAQIHGRNKLSFKERFRLDAWYVKHKSFWLDIHILARTFGKVLDRSGVYVDANTTSPKFDGSN